MQIFLNRVQPRDGNKKTRSLLKKLSGMFFLSLLVFSLAGCSTVGYYSQIVSGHMRIVLGKRSVADVVSDESVDDSTKHSLQVAQKARQFAVKRLGLPDNESYTSFYDTGRRFVTWNVVAAQEFSFNPATWCFPIAGCVTYRGYYTEEDASAYAQVLADQGLDVAVNGATAYSTLGWFKDPLLNTMLRRSDFSLASLLFHELAHQQLYVSDDSTFNESFATFVEIEGLRQWQQHEEQNNPSAQLTEMSKRLAERKQRREEFIQLLSRTRDDLQEIYGSPLDETEMRAAKVARFDQMRDEYETLKESWDGFKGYDGWFKRGLNNARLVSVATYNDYVPAFEEMFKQNGSSFEKFYSKALEVSKMPASERTEIMEQLLLKVATASN